MTHNFITRPALSTFSGGLTLVLMAGLTFASAATLARPAVEAAPVVHQLPAVVMTVKAATIHQLPTVFVSTRRSAQG